MNRADLDFGTDAALLGLLAQALPPQLERRREWLAVKNGAGGAYLYANAAMAEFLGRPREEVVGRRDADLFDAALAAALRAADTAAVDHGAPLITEHGFEHGGARHVYSVLRVANERVDDQGRRLLLSVWTDLGVERQRDERLRVALHQIEQQQQANELLRREIADQALRDPACGLYRRAHFDEQFRREVDLSSREHREFAVVLIELDDPTASVRALGDAGGTRLLEAMGRLLRGGTRAMDASCRYDDRRFAVLLSGVGLATAHARMESLRRQCAAQIVVHDGQELRFTVSIGVASYPHTAQTREALQIACESALVEARRRGGNQVTLSAIAFDAG